jgi:hypothetical protein
VREPCKESHCSTMLYCKSVREVVVFDEYACQLSAVSSKSRLKNIVHHKLHREARQLWPKSKDVVVKIEIRISV